MRTEEFEESVERLATQIMATIEAFFKEEKFDHTLMGEFGSQDIRQLAIDAHMFGADIYAT